MVRVIVVNTGESVGISFGDIVGIVADRFVNDPIHHFPSVSGMGDVVDTESMVSDVYVCVCVYTCIASW